MAEQNWRRRLVLVGWVSAAALLLAAAALWVYASNLREQRDDVQLRLVDAVTKLEMAQEDAESARDDLTSLRTNLGLLTAADVVELSLVGQTGAPEASGRAFISRSNGLLFTASRLPVSSEGRSFQLWYLTSTGPVSAGVVQAEPTGGVVAVLPVPQDLPTLTGFAASREGAASSSESNGAFLLKTR